MLNYIIRRLLIAVPTLLFISLAIFLLLDLAPGDPTAQMPLTVPPEVREKIRIAREAARDFVAEVDLSISRVAVIGFDTGARRYIGLSQDASAIYRLTTEKHLDRFPVWTGAVAQ